jgi:hypothetical protein
MDDRGIEIRFPTKTRGVLFSRLDIRSHPASHTMGTGGSFLGGRKVAGAFT